ncbi:SRPBCC family protein [Smaragdicoccus niigatensis]|uniref:SRPBCC family protein n=1 Tax=Smaragdicoccus niigatensis TaxID=359359 RepID=UPI000361793E|nr:SRPBCC family protein [Smaragdicoccus niigatensis]
MAGQFEGSAFVSKPIEEVFNYLAAGVNDPKFSPRVLKIEKATAGPVGVGTVFVSTVKDAGMTTSREIEITEFDPPRSFRWTEISKNIVTSKRGGYDLEPAAGGTNVTIFNELEGHGFGKLIAPLALKAARKEAPALAQRIKDAIEAS